MIDNDDHDNDDDDDNDDDRDDHDNNCRRQNLDFFRVFSLVFQLVLVSCNWFPLFCGKLGSRVIYFSSVLWEL